MKLASKIINKANQLSSLGGFIKLPAEEYQKLELERLLLKAQNTEFGIHYNFNSILNAPKLIQAYQESVPIFTYEKIFEKWWHSLLIPQPNITWPGQVKHFALSSGTSNATTKYIPVTDIMTKSMRRAALKMFFSLKNHNIPAHLFTRHMLLIGSSSQLNEQRGYFTGDLSGINAKNPPFWIKGYYKPGGEIAKIKDWKERLHEICKESKNWDVGFVSGVASWVQLTVESIMEYHKIDDIHELWPNLKIFVNGGVALDPYRDSFQKLCSKPITFLDSYLASEGFIAFQNRPNTKSMVMLLNNNIFFEFVAFNDKNFDDEGNIYPNAKALHIGEVVENENYALVLSTCAGAWRYLIGDTIKFTDLEKKEIIITGRTKHFLSLCGEHLSVDNMNQAIINLQNRFNILIKEFTVHGVSEDGYFAHQWYLGTDTDIDEKILAEHLDEELKKTNDDYATEREGNLLRNVYVKKVNTDLFFNWLQNKSSTGGQNKFPRVLKGDRINEWKSFIIRNSTN